MTEPSVGASMSRQNNKTLQKHLSWLRATGKMSSWLEKRLEWDEVTRNEILAEIFNRNQLQDIVNLQMQYTRHAIEQQFKKQSAFYKLYAGGVR